MADGPDPWGGCFPGPSNTGVPSGTQLTAYTGPCRITTANTVIDSKIVNCSLDIATSGVVIRNSLVNGSIDIFDDTDSVSVMDSNDRRRRCQRDLQHGRAGDHGPQLLAAAGRDDPRRQRRLVQYDCTIKDSWIHAQDKDEGGYAHMSGFRQGGGSLPNSQQFLHNSIACDAPVVEPDAGCSADITGYGDFETVKNNLLEKNLLMESPGGRLLRLRRIVG